MKKTDSGEPKATRQCWECLKRRLVCDHTLPGCRKCQKAGKECPGYDEQKPLQWVETGKVTSRRRRRDCPPKVYKVPAPKPAKRLVEITDLAPVPVVDPDLTYPEMCDPNMALGFKIWEESDQSLKEYLDDMYSEESVKKYSNLMMAGGEVMDIIFALGGREKIEEIVAKKDREAAVRITKKTTFALERLQRLLDIMDSYDLPTYHYLSNETSEVVQAVNYYNIRIHPAVTEAAALAPNPTLVLFPLKALHILPPAIHHALVCLALNHHIHSLPSGADKSSLMSQRSKVYHHRGEAIRSLSQYVGKDKTRCSDFTISSILVFLSTELQNPAMADWRSHAHGIQRLIDMRGGLKSLTKQAPHLAPTLVVYILIVVMANSCSPSWDQISMSGTPESNLEDIKSMYNLIFPFVLCPPTLFLDIVRVNQLRQRASTSIFVGDVDTGHCLEAHDLLGCIESFIPEDWAQPGPNYEEWLTLGTVYQAAAALYCTMSLQSLTILPNSLEMNSMRAIHGDRLLAGLKQAMKSKRLQYFMMWPLTVAGVEAGYRGAATQYWIAKQFEEQSRALGTSSPLKAQAVMRRYWQKEEPGWDECFDRAEAVFPPFNGT